MQNSVVRRGLCRFKFWEFQRPEAQPFDEFLSQLKYLVGKCEFLEKDNMVRDKIIFFPQR